MKSSTTVLVLILMLIFNSLTFSQDIKETLFKDAKKSLNSALKMKADVLSPTNYEAAFEYFKEAEEDFKTGGDLNDIKEALTKAIFHANKAKKVVELANVTCSSAIKAREDAVSANAKENASELWKDAEEKFRDACEQLEDGDAKDAEEISKEAEQLYRKAELEAIKVAYLEDTWELLKKAEDEDVADKAPKTLAKAKELITKAEKELQENRYDTDVPRTLAQEANYEVKHAFYINEYAKNAEDSDKTIEDMILEAEAALNKIAVVLNSKPDFSKGIDKSADKLAGLISKLQTERDSLANTLEEAKQKIKLLEEQVSGMSKEKSKLAEQMAKIEKIRQQYESIRKLFNDNEALVYKSGNDIIVRLVGLNFPSGKSTIEPKYFGLLAKVQKAIKMVPNSKITIEGHTDSFGSDEKNMELSQERAFAVKQYLIANMNLPQDRIESIGYGETKPIANNQTKEGRAKNRRIDLVIHTNPEM